MKKDVSLDNNYSFLRDSLNDRAEMTPINIYTKSTDYSMRTGGQTIFTNRS